MVFSNETRKQTIHQLKHTELDLLIVGGGITGAGVAIQASASGIKTGLIEMRKAPVRVRPNWYTAVFAILNLLMLALSLTLLRNAPSCKGSRRISRGHSQCCCQFIKNPAVRLTCSASKLPWISMIDWLVLKVLSTPIIP